MWTWIGSNPCDRWSAATSGARPGSGAPGSRRCPGPRSIASARGSRSRVRSRCAVRWPHWPPFRKPRGRPAWWPRPRATTAWAWPLPRAFFRCRPQWWCLAIRRRSRSRAWKRTARGSSRRHTPGTTIPSAGPSTTWIAFRAGSCLPSRIQRSWPATAARWRWRSSRRHWNWTPWSSPAAEGAAWSARPWRPGPGVRAPVSWP